VNHHLTFDIEDYFEPEELESPADLPRYEGQVVANTERILALLRETRTRATFFVVGKVAERHPCIVESIVAEGHVLGSHGYAHLPTQVLGDRGFEDDLCRSKRILEALTRTEVSRFRAMGFSIADDIPRRLAQVRNAGYCLDSSVLESRLGPSMPREVPITEVPVSSVRVLGRHLPLGGGIAFRLAPLPVLRRVLRHYDRRRRCFVVYLHAWEFNRDQPRRKVPLAQRWAQSPITFSAERKLRALLRDFPFTPL
jgi:polysaccharide deacetylase family protein (PEP-CTERM system associated)